MRAPARAALGGIMKRTRRSALLLGVGIAGPLTAFLAGLGADRLVSGTPLVGTYRSSPRAIAHRAFPSVVQLALRDERARVIRVASGFVVAPGIVATSAHVIDGAVGGDVTRAGDEERHAIVGVVALDAAHDLALVRIAETIGTPLVLADSEAVEVGDEVFAIGSAGGYEGTFSQGLVSGIRRSGSRPLLQITAPMSHGSSGGPILDGRGRVVGVATALVERGQNLNFATPASALKVLLARLHASPALAAEWPSSPLRTRVPEASDPASAADIPTAATWSAPGDSR